MDRAIPCGSKLCARREQTRRHEMHKERLKGIRPLVDTSEPLVASMEHVRSNLKREQMLEERYSEIDRENRILLGKMSDIMKQPQGTPRQGERPPGPMSLNRDARKKELLRITKENQSILKRIQQAQPVYNHVEWEGGHRKNVAYLRNCAEYPLILRTPRSARGENTATSELIPLQEERQQESRPQSARSLPLPRLPPQPPAHQQVGLQQEIRDEHVQDGGMKCVFKEGRKLGGTYYLLEMATDGSGALFVTAYDGEARTQLELTVKERVHRRVFREMNGDYGLIAARLQVLTDAAGLHRLVLEEPSPPTSAPTRGTSAGGEELDAETMVVYRNKTSSAGSVHAEIDLGSSLGNAQVRIRGLTPSTEDGVHRW